MENLRRGGDFQAGVVAGQDIVAHRDPGVRALAPQARRRVVDDGVELGLAGRAAGEEDADTVAPQDVAAETDGVGRARHADASISRAITGASEGEAAHLGLDRAGQRDHIARPAAVEGRLLRAAADEMDVARHGHALVVRAGADANGKRGEAARRIDGGRGNLRRVHRVLDPAEGVHAPGQAVVDTGRVDRRVAIGLVGVEGRLAHLKRADVHTAVGTGRRRVGRVARIRRWRADARAEVELVGRSEVRVEGDIARTKGGLGRAVVNLHIAGVEPEQVIAVQLSWRRVTRRTRALIIERDAAVGGEDCVAHIHRRAAGRTQTIGVVDQRIIDNFKLGRGPILADGRRRAANDVAERADT